VLHLLLLTFYLLLTVVVDFYLRTLELKYMYKNFKENLKYNLNVFIFTVFVITGNTEFDLGLYIIFRLTL